jgi:tetratricopeptide (TPR) repeat protein
MIVRDGAETLSACLASAAGLANDIVVVDTGSTDGTADIARAHGACVVPFSWCDDFSAARNESLRHARGDWVFWLDADDRLPRDSHAKLRALFSALPDTPDGYSMRCACVSSVALAQQEVAHVRLFRAGPDVRFRYRVHEQIAPAILRRGGRIHPTNIVIEHLGYADAATRRRKQERNLRLLELACAEESDPFMLYYRGVALLDLDRSAEALVSLVLAESLVPAGSTAARLLAIHLTEAYHREGMHAEAERVRRAAVAACPTDPGLVFGEALEAYFAGDVARVARDLSGFLAGLAGAAEAENFAGDRSIGAFRARNLYGSALYLLGRHAEAEAEARRVIDVSPSFGDAWLLLGDALQAQGKRADVDALLREIESGEGGDVLAALLRASAAALAGDASAAMALLARAADEGEGHPFVGRARDRLARGGLPVPPAAHCLASSVMAGGGRAAIVRARPAVLDPVHPGPAAEVSFGKDTSAAFVVKTVTPPGYADVAALHELGEALHHGLAALGGRAGGLRAEAGTPRTIVLGAHLLRPEDPDLADDAVLYNTEQVAQSREWMTPRYVELLRRHAVWDYSQANVAALQRLGVSAQHVPVGYVPELTRIPRAEEDVDVVFAGSVNARRATVLDGLARRGLSVKTLTHVYGAARDRWLARARIVLNLHYADGSPFEVVRVSYLLANRRFVVTESSPGDLDEGAFEGGVVVADYDALVDACLRYLEAPGERARVAEVGLARIRARPMEPILRSALESLRGRAT